MKFLVIEKVKIVGVWFLKGYFYFINNFIYNLKKRKLLLCRLIVYIVEICILFGFLFLKI